MAWKPLEGAAGGLRLAPATLQPSGPGRPVGEAR